MALQKNSWIFVKGVGSWVDVGGCIITIWGGGGIMNRDPFSLVSTDGLDWCFVCFLLVLRGISSSW